MPPHSTQIISKKLSQFPLLFHIKYQHSYLHPFHTSPPSSMSTVGFQDSSYKVYCKKSMHCRNDSGELDVFEASRYFSVVPEMDGGGGTQPPSSAAKEEKPIWGGRKSLDTASNHTFPPHSFKVEKHMVKEKITPQSKQPSSPGGRLASFLNSLFTQASSKKKKSKSSSKSGKDEEEGPGGRRKRRSSISHCSAGSTDSKPMYSSSAAGPGFRTPPPNSHTPTKVYKDLRSYSDHKQVVPLSNCSTVKIRSVSFCLQHMHEPPLHDKKVVCPDENFNLGDEISGQKKRISLNGCLEKSVVSGRVVSWADEISCYKSFRRSGDEEDVGGESDSSSDLFELQNYELSAYPNGLPVYETTKMEGIHRGAPIARGSL